MSSAASITATATRSVESCDAPKIAYIMSRFPKITETFVLYEILELQRQGFSVGVFPLLRQKEQVTHPEVEQLMSCVTHTSFLSFSVLRANLHYLSHHPRKYLRMLYKVLRGNFSGVSLFVKSLLILPKSVLLARELSSAGYRHIHAHFATHPALAALIINNLTDIPFSFTAHGSDIHKHQQMLDVKLREAAFIVTISQYNVDFLADIFGRKNLNNIEIVRCGVDLRRFQASEQRQAGATIRIVCVASLREVKGHKHLLEACRILNNRGISFECHLIGDGKLRQELEELVDTLGLGSSVVFHGARGQPYVINMMQNSDIAALTSIRSSSGNREGVPVSLMEAMAIGLPVVSSQLSGIPELVESGVTGILTPPGDATAIANALETLGRDIELQDSMGRAGRAKVMAEFNQSRTVTRLARLFRESLAV